MPDFASITDLINAGYGDKQTPQGYMGALFDDPEYRRQRAFDMLGNVGAALLKASGPSAVPMDFGSVLAQGLAGANEGRQASEDRYLRRLMTGSQIAKNQSEMERDKEWSDLFKTPSAATPSPGPTMPASAPTAAPGSAPNAFNVGNVRPVGSNTGFQQPASLDDGIRLAVNNVKAYPGQFNGGQPMTLLQIGQRWAPKGDGANDPNQWALNVGSIGGLDPNQPLDFNDPAIAAKFARGVHGAEWGQAALKDPAVYTAALTNPGVAQGSGGDGSGNPVQPAQYTPPVARPQSIQDVIATMPEGVRKMVGAMPRKDGMAIVMKYADPGSTAAIDSTTGQVVFVPSTVIGRDPRFQPVEGAKLQIERDKLTNSQRATDNTIANSDVTIGPDGRPVVNQTVVDAKKAVSAAQGTDPEGKIRLSLAEDAIKRNSDWQKNGLQAQSTIYNLNQFEKLAETVKQGRFQGSTTDLKAALKGFGVNLEAFGIPDNVGPAQAMQMLSQRFALEMRQEMPGPMSDGDRQFMERGAISIDRDPQANKIMIEWLRGNAERAKDRAKFANEYVRSKNFTTDPAGIDAYVSERLAAKDYFNKDVLPQQSDAPAGTIPPPPAGFRAPGGAAPSIPAPPAGFRMVP